MEQQINEVTLEVTNRCTNNCIFCSSSSINDNSEDMSIQDCFKVLREVVARKEHCEVHLSGGEPLLHEGIYSLISLFSTNSKGISLYTTGIGIDYTKMRTTDYRDTKLVFNFQSSYEGAHNKLCGNNSWVQTKNSMQNAISDGFKNVEVHIIPNKINLHTLEDTVYFLNDIKVSKISFLKLVYQGRAVENWNLLKLDTEDQRYLYTLFQRLKNLKMNATELRFGIPFSRGGKTCNSGVNKLLIRCNGRIYPCEAFKNDILMNIGHIDEQDSFLFAQKRASDLCILNKAKESVNNFESCAAQMCPSFNNIDDFQGILI